MMKAEPSIDDFHRRPSVTSELPETARPTTARPSTVFEGLGADPSTAAIVVTDMVNHQVDPGRGMLELLRQNGAAVEYFVQRIEEVVTPNHQQLLKAARSAGMPVVFTTIGGARRDYLDLNPNLRHIGGWGARLGTSDTEVISAIDIGEDDIILGKSGSSSFHTSPLDSCLRNMGVKSVFYTGVITNGCVLASALAGFDLGYRGYLVSDATATMSDHWQRTAEEVLSLYTAGIVSTADVVELVAPTPP